VLEFEFTADAEAVFFEYVFASDEYNEYVNSQFNDTFAFFINGTNCAVIDDGVSDDFAIGNVPENDRTHARHSATTDTERRVLFPLLEHCTSADIGIVVNLDPAVTAHSGAKV
jgi:hypothetical protein